MKKQQTILALSGVVLLVLVYFFGQTIPPKKNSPMPAAENAGAEAKPIDIQDILKASQAKLNPSQAEYVDRLEHSVVRGDVKEQQLKAYRQLAAFWKDSVQNGFLPFAYYNGQIAKLENSEKNLTFAAQLFLENLRLLDDPALKSWMATQAKELFKQALQINPDNDSSKIGLGASYIFGSSAGNPQEVMQGIQQILEVSRRDSTNMYAQFMLGLGGAISGQYDKAIERLTKVVQHQPDNLEAIMKLAEINEHKGDKQEAVKWYEESKKWISDPAALKEINIRIKSLQ
ncbi:MAG: tetratricopeptide repeat protein [Bacteroidetes bacterium]|nr:tetratricopeptide repeat protein [Bacteroidota bacterium]